MPIDKSTKQKRYYERNRERLRAYQEDYRKRRTEWYLHSAIKSRAKKEGIPFNIDVEDIVIPDKCPVLGIKLVRGQRGFCDTSPSVDKTIPNLGYVKGNIEVVSYRANKAKNNLSLEELVAIGKWAEHKLSLNRIKAEYDERH